jgi:parallel beta-helix repeat protein
LRFNGDPRIRGRAIVLWAALAMPLAVGVVAGAGPALAAKLSCGDIVSTDTVLENDILGCNGPGLGIAADGVTLDLNGHTIAGSGLGFGVFPIGRLRDITVQNGTVSGFRNGVSLDFLNRPTVRSMTLVGGHDGIVVLESVDAVIEHNVAVGNDASGIFVSETTRGLFADNDLSQNAAGITGTEVSDAVFERNRVRGSSYDGIHFLDASGVRFEQNRSSDNGALGIGLEGDLSGDVLTRNVADRNGDDGIYLDAPGVTLTRNSADRNGDLGIEAVPGVTDGGHNKARHNGNPAQCLDLSC